MRRVTLSLAMLLGIHGSDALPEPTVAHKQDVLLIRVDKPGTFEVIYHRTAPAGAGAVLGGLIGAAIQTGAQSSQDGTKTAQVLERIDDPSCIKPFLKALTETLAKNGQPIATIESAPEGKGAGRTVTVRIDECGFRLVDTTSETLAAFVTSEITVDGAGKNSPHSERIQITGRNRQAFDGLLQDDGFAQKELKATLQRAGTRAAHKIVYQRQGD